MRTVTLASLLYATAAAMLMDEWTQHPWMGGAACLLVDGAPKEFDEARAFCIKVGGELVSTHSRADHDTAMDIMYGVESNLWSGLRNDADGRGWHWSDGTPYDYTGGWGSPGQPDYGGAPPTCNVYCRSHRGWDDVACTWRSRALCAATLCPAGQSECAATCESRPCAKASACGMVDPGANCTDDLANGEPVCQCSASRDPPHCIAEAGMQRTIEGVMHALEMTPETDDEVKSVKLSNALTFDMVTFMSADERLASSWSMEELSVGFANWCYYEGQPCNVSVDIKVWNNPTLGNCFTFNPNETADNEIRWSGAGGGVHMRFNVRQEDYTSWIRQAGMRVFVHDRQRAIFDESPSVTAGTGEVTLIAAEFVDQMILGGAYGGCVSYPSEVDNYFYGTEYTKEGCRRTCHQVRVNTTCGCMDPRFEAPGTERTCTKADIQCLEAFIDASVDPGDWPECKCPPRCSMRAYSLDVSRAPQPVKLAACDAKGDAASVRQCYYDHTVNYVALSVYLKSNMYLVFEEVPAYPVIQVPVNVGGLLGLLAGISVLSIAEFLFTLLQIIVAIPTTFCK